MVQLPRHSRAASSAAASPSTVPGAIRRRRSKTIKAMLLIQSAEVDDVSTPVRPAYETALKADQSPLRSAFSIRARSTASTTTRRRASRPPRPSSRGSARSLSSTPVFANDKAREAVFTARIPTCVTLCESSRPSRSACVSPLRQSGSRSAAQSPQILLPTQRRASSRAAQAVVATLDEAGKAEVQFPFERPQKTKLVELFRSASFSAKVCSERPDAAAARRREHAPRQRRSARTGYARSPRSWVVTRHCG